MGLVRRDRVDPELRARKQAEWNRPVLWPMALLIVGGLALVGVARRSFRQREAATAKRGLHPSGQAQG